MSTDTLPHTWIARSDRHARRYLEVQATFAPETVAEFGLLGHDEATIDLSPGHVARQRAALEAGLAELEAALARETERPVREDLAIMVEHARMALRELELSERLLVPYFSVVTFVFSAIKSLLDEQIAPERRAAALVRLRRYAGRVEGTAPLAELALNELREHLDQGRVAPTRAELERDLASTAALVEGMRQLFVAHGLEGWDAPLQELETQLTAFDAFVRAELLPRAREDFRLPAELYDFLLAQNGIDRPIMEIAAHARSTYLELQAQLAALAPEVAAARGLAATDYPTVLQALKAEQIVGDEVLPLYRDTLAQLETLMRTHDLMTLPGSEVRIRLATEAESTRLPSPHLEIPRLVDNQGEQGVFVLPLFVPPAPGASEALKLDDFSHAAAAWPVTAHEARPGHELQFATMVERGTSLARAVFCFNSTNAEGWALYCEHLMLPYMPAEARLAALQLRLLRAARAFLDPELQQGAMTPAAAFQLLREEVGISEAMATQEVERYTFRAPAQAVTYHYGLVRLLELRTELEAALGDRFRLRAFHDAVLDQGLLPPDLLREAVRAQLLTPER